MSQMKIGPLVSSGQGCYREIIYSLLALFGAEQKSFWLIYNSSLVIFQNGFPSVLMLLGNCQSTLLKRIEDGWILLLL
jgi:hypothetical protein